MKLEKLPTIVGRKFQIIFKNAELGDFMIMPNHVHGIIIVNGIATEDNAETGHALSQRHALSLHDHETTIDQQPINNQPPTHFRFRNQGKNTVSAMIGSFKSSVTRLARPINKNFAWQSRFHDHIIRSQDDYARILNYIRNNPANWKDDRFY